MNELMERRPLSRSGITECRNVFRSKTPKAVFTSSALDFIKFYENGF